MRVLAAVLAFLVLFPVAAQGDTFVSNRFGFSADFPGTPAVGEPKPSETDSKGRTVADLVMIKSEVAGVYTAMVTVETYTVPTPIDVPSTLAAQSLGFVGGMEGVMSGVKSVKIDGFRARRFHYATPDKSAVGDGLVVIVTGRLPRIYLVLTMRTPQSSEEDAALLKAFINSFHLQ
ncbi:MAG: hypothetical protein KGJ78_14190 [Alphaproteobacteria bacterium]|nr:hypothetical protein [Alphaproteobacteria bacterium]